MADPDRIEPRGSVLRADRVVLTVTCGVVALMAVGAAARALVGVGSPYCLQDVRRGRLAACPA